jgi:hypothetical protein
VIRRENSRRRRPAYREEQPLFLVLCGGDVTEPDYFRGLKMHRRKSSLKIVVKKKGIDPTGLVSRDSVVFTLRCCRRVS